MNFSIVVVFSLLVVLYLPRYAEGHALCSDGTDALNYVNSFCTMYSGESCCTSTKDSIVQTNATAHNISDPACFDVLKKLLCARCDPWAAHIIGGEADPVIHEVPKLCTSYCDTVYSACKNVNLNPLFPPFFVSSIAATWSTSDAFCSAFNSTGYCFNGNPYTPPNITPTPSTPRGLCIEMVAGKVAGKQDVISFGSPNDNSSRIFVSTRDGVIKGYRKTASGLFTDLGVFLDMQSKVSLVGEGGILGLAFHPDFGSNGRFFVSYTCDPTQGCNWPCTTNSQCLHGGSCVNGSCNDHVLLSVVDEYRVSENNSNVANPTKFKNVFNVSQPGANHKAGQIQFGPDGYLYLSFGDGGGAGGFMPQVTSSYMGKILRIDVNVPDTQKYAIPSDNPFVGVSGYLPEIWALGFRNPWRGSFDSLTGALYIGDVGQDMIEEMNVVEKGKNYGWKRWEGFLFYLNTPGPNVTSAAWPNLYYQHDQMPGTSACIIGGNVYRGSRDTCNQGYYLFADLDERLMGAQESPPGSKTYTWNFLTWNCYAAPGATSTCTNQRMTKIYSFGEDSDKDLYILNSWGVGRVVEQSKCPALQCVPLDGGLTTATISTTSAVTSGGVTSSSLTTGSVTSGRFTSGVAPVTTALTTSPLSTGSVTTSALTTSPLTTGVTTGNGACVTAPLVWTIDASTVRTEQFLTTNIKCEARYQIFPVSPDLFETFVQYIFNINGTERRTNFKLRIYSIIEFTDTNNDGYNSTDPITQTYVMNPITNYFPNYVTVSSSPRIARSISTDGSIIMTAVIDEANAACIYKAAPKIDLYLDINFTNKTVGTNTKLALVTRYSYYETLGGIAQTVQTGLSAYPKNAFGPVDNTIVAVDINNNQVSIPVKSTAWVESGTATLRQFDVTYTIDSTNRALRYQTWKIVSSRLNLPWDIAPVTTGSFTSSPLTTGPLTSSPLTTSELTSSPLTAAGVTSAEMTTSPLTTSEVTSSPVNSATSGSLTSGQVASSEVTSSPLTTSVVGSGRVTTSFLTSSAVTSSPLTTSVGSGRATTSSLTSGRSGSTSSPLTSGRVQATTGAIVSTGELTTSKITGRLYTTGTDDLESFITGSASTLSFLGYWILIIYVCVLL